MYYSHFLLPFSARVDESALEMNVNEVYAVVRSEDIETRPNVVYDVISDVIETRPNEAYGTSHR